MDGPQIPDHDRVKGVVSSRSPGDAAPDWETAASTLAPYGSVRVVAREQLEARRSARMRAARWAISAVAVLVIGAVVSSFRGSSASGSYTVTQGSAGPSVYLTLPVHVGAWTQLEEDGSPIWNLYPSLLPGSPPDTYENVGALYTGPTAPGSMVEVDVLFAKGSNGHPAVFSASPQKLVDLITSSMYLHDARHSPASAGTETECSDYVGGPVCFWADRSTLGYITFIGTSGTLDQLAAMTPSFQAALIRQ